MNDRDIDRILSREEDIRVPADFTASVMDAVRRDAALPPPIPFPWRQALPGLTAALLRTLPSDGEHESWTTTRKVAIRVSLL